MGKKVKCQNCSRKFNGKNALKHHKRDKHSNESFASRAINAQLDHAMGVNNPDYDWLVEPYK